MGKKEKTKKEELSLAEMKRQLDTTTAEMNELIDAMRNMIYFRDNWKRFILYNLSAGILRGLGMALGSTIILGTLLYIISQLVELNLPLISDWLSMFIDMVEQKRGLMQ